MVKQYWKQFGETATADGQEMWMCPVCNRGIHICKRDENDGNDHCPDCKTPLSYPWEKG